MAKFTRRYSKPTKADKCFVLKQDGGWNDCVVGCPTDKECRCLSNCVGYASGRYNEIYNELTGKTGCNFPGLNCNAENFIERVQQKYPNITISQIAKPGAIMVWQKGTLASKDGAGHVAIVEDILETDSKGNPTSVRASESSYGGSAFYNVVRKKGSGNWGLGSAYTFRAFIWNPAEETEAALPKPVAKNTNKNQLYVGAINLRIRSGASTCDKQIGLCKSKSYYNVLEVCKKSDYTWYKLGDGAWVAGVGGTTYYPSVAEQKKKLQAQLAELKEKREDLEEQLEDVNCEIKEVEAKLKKL